MQQLALMGLGVMGAAMAANLLQRGFPLSIWNRTRAKAEALAALGARIAETPADAARDADMIFSVVGDDDASRAVWLGERGALAGAAPGAICIEASTLSVEWVRELTALAQARGLRFLEAPLFGSREAAANAQLGLVVGGEAAVVEAARPALEAVSRRIVHLGPSGSAAAWKLINNMLGAVHLVSIAEALRMAERAGLDMEQVPALILNGVVGSPMTQAKLPRMVAGRYDEADFELQWMKKDIAYAAQLAESLGVTASVARAALAVYLKAMTDGLGTADAAAVAEAVGR